MSGAIKEKSRGLKFAEQQLIRHGWEQGKGLGRDENGISEAIKVKVKCDKGGVGHRQGEQFTFHWWDHIFNKASSNLVVESGQDGVNVKKVSEEEGMISNKKPRKAELAKAKLYGRFVKSGTLWAGEEKTEKKCSSSEDSSESEDEDQRLDLSSTTKLSDEDLVKACGGRTAHKGARHGLTMSAKLARLEQQELEFLAKYGKKNHTENLTSRESIPSSAGLRHKGEEPERDECEGQNAKKKRKKKMCEDKEERMAREDRKTVPEKLLESDELPVVPRKHKKRSKERQEAVVVEQLSSPSSTQKSRRKKKRSVKAEVSGEEGENCDSAYEVRDDCKSVENACTEQQGEHALIPEVSHDKNVSKKKKRTKNKMETSVATEENCCNGTESNLAETVPKKKRKERSDTHTLLVEPEEERNTQVQKKKKKKKMKV